MTTNEEAKCSCNRCEIGYCYKNCDKYNEWQERAEAALEKQIPKKPTENCECAVCGIDLVLNDTLHDGQRINYCPMCGQAIRWENDND